MNCWLPCACNQDRASRDCVMTSYGSALERNDTCIDVRQGGLLGNTEKLSSTQTALPWDSLGQCIRNVAGAGEIISNHSEKHRSHSKQTIGQTAARFFKNPFLRNRVNRATRPRSELLRKSRHPIGLLPVYCPKVTYELTYARRNIPAERIDGHYIAFR